MRVAALQMTSTADKPANLAIAEHLIADAVAHGADLLVLPEMFNCLGSGAELRAGAERLDGPTATWAGEQAGVHGVWLVAGSFIEQDGDRLTNTCCVFAPDGERVAVYRKIHLFDITVPGAGYHESSLIAPGDDLVVTKAGVLNVGLSICYDLRFPELYRILTLQGATLLTVPAAFTATTGPPHWEVLLRARAIENQCFVVAAAQVGDTNENLHWHGHALIIDPWGRVLAEAPGYADQPGAGGTFVVADLDLDDQHRIREVLPSLANRRPSAYRWPAG